MEVDQRYLERILDGVEDPRDLPFGLLKDITNGFSKERKIGEGGFGEVFKGVLGERIVAVKRIHINEHTFDEDEFRNEVTTLMNINHPNVVQFLGFFSGGYQKIKEDGSGQFIWAKVLERLLCFRYISNGSLDRHIKDELRGLEWGTRYDIITGICKGLRYLHKEKNIIHMDLKPANILLDYQDEKYMVPKITDFGLSRPNKNLHTVGQCCGTIEYMAPEYKEESKITQSCDIYSLGLIIIELVTGCKDVPNKDNVLRRWRHRWKKPPTQLQYQQVTRCIDIAGRCRRKNPKDRPSISKIINFLSESESTYSQISPSLNEDDMLRINPLELRLPSELENEMSCSIELTNDTRNCIFSFNIQLPSARYNVQPDKGIVRPESKYGVKITVQARDVGERDHADKFIVQSMQMKAGEVLRDKVITEGMFKKTGRITDEVDLIILYECTKPQENCKHSDDTTNMPAEPKNCESSSGSIGKAEAASMECTNFNPAARPNTPHIINRLDKIKLVSYESENTAEAMMDHISEMPHGSDKVDVMGVAALSDPCSLLGVYQDIPNSPGETSSKENATSTNPCNRILEYTANLDKLIETMRSLNQDIMRCFEFCSIFPKGYKLRRDQLVRLWIAHGFVNTSCATYDMEDIAEGYIQELLSVSFLQKIETKCPSLHPIVTGYDTNLFKIHDDLHDILDKVPGNCFRIENARTNRGEVCEVNVPRHIQHLFIQNYDGEFITETIIGLECLHTLIVYVVGKDTPIEEKVIDIICKRLPKLRVLAVAFSEEHDPIEQPNKFSVPESIGQLKYLRYLSFRTDRFCTITLPNTLNKLQHIQLLDFGMGDIMEFTFTELVNLRHIFCSNLNLPYIGRLSSLETLSGIEVSNEQGCELKQLGGLNKLRGQLHIDGLGNVKSKGQALEANLAAKRLTELTLIWGYDDDTRCRPEVEVDVLEGLCPPVGLKKLSLFKFVGWRYPDWMVGTHSGGPKCLQELHLCRCSLPVPASGLAEAFPRLRVLHIVLCSWDALPTNMELLTSLKELEIVGCKNIRSLPTMPPFLEKFDLSLCNHKFMKSCKTVGDPNWQKIAHIPRKTIEVLSIMERMQWTILDHLIIRRIL